MPNLGACPGEFRDYGLYEEGDRVSINHDIVVECMGWPNSLYCSQTGFEPFHMSSPSSDNNWKHAWKVVGYCTGTNAPIPSNPSQDRGCPEEWSFGNHQTYKENDQVSVTVATTPVKVQAIFKCKPWPYSSFCSMLSPIDTAGGQMGWTYGGDCAGTYTPTSAPTFDPLSILSGGCPDEFNLSSSSSKYKAGSKVSLTVTTTPLQKVVYQCREWPNSVYCNKITFAPGEEYDYLAWTRLGPCDGSTMVPTTSAPTPTPAPATNSPTQTNAPTNAPTPTIAPTQTKVPTNSPTQTSPPSTVAPSSPVTGATLDTWTGIAGGSIADLRTGTNNLATVPNQSVLYSGSLLEVTNDVVPSSGIRMSGWLVPPTTGNYKFWIAADMTGELWLSTNGNPANKEKICECTSAVGSRAWDVSPEQASTDIALVAGQAYYYEVSNRLSSACWPFQCWFSRGKRQ